MRAIEAARRQLDPARYLEVKYESFCDEPLETYHRVLDFAELPRSAAFDRDVKDASIRSTSNRWRDDLAPAQQTLLDDLLRDDLRRIGYGETAKVSGRREAVAR